MSLFELLTLVLSALAVVVAAVAFFGSRGAARRSANAAVRSADAAEAAVTEQRRANDLVLAERASRAAAWGEPRPIAEYRYEVANHGTATAFGAYLTRENGQVDELRPPHDVEPGDGLSFACAIRGTPANRTSVRVNWRDADGNERSEVRAV